MEEYFDDIYEEEDEDSYLIHKKNGNSDSRSKLKYEARRKIDDYFFQKSMREQGLEDDWDWEEDSKDRSHLH